jgi:Do/DeqQ family serine protease
LFGTPQPESRSRQEVASGSGVILSEDGFIVTNNHVIDEADEIEVTLFDNRTLKATLIGTDPSTDLALLKVDTDQLLIPIHLGNSDSALVGEWVLAVGNPFDLTSTVTAGIISAKGRNINILSRQSRMPIESFIQTDAAVNPGNSGGALVNTRGELVGINTAIATPTGTFAGYSFAVPVNIVKKVITDLREFGVVQRAFLGVQIRDVDEQLAEEEGLRSRQGVYILEVNENSGALDAGLQQGDVIVGINGNAVTSVAELQEQVSRYRPGDKVDVDFLRDGEALRKQVTLKNQMNGTEVVEKKTTEVLVDLGATFEDLTAGEKRQFDIDGGVRISDLRTGKLTRNTNIREGFIITRIDRKSITSANDLIDALEAKEAGDGVMLEGFYPQNPSKTYYYAFGM